MKKILIFVAAFCCLTAAVAVEQMALDINFSRPAWKAVVKTLWGAGPQVAGDALEFGPGSFAALPLIPCLPGSTVRIEFDAETTDIESAGAAWRTAAVQLGLFTGDKEQAHLDLFNTGKATARHRVSRSIPLKNSGFRLCFGNYGRTGKFRIANLKVALDVPGRNLERDGSFSGMFGINDWFVRKSGKDWDGLGLGRHGSARVEAGLFPSPGKTLVLDGAGTVTGRQFPYNGEALVVGGWYMQQGIRRAAGAPPWANAGIQLVYLDADDKPIGHRDVTSRLLDGDRPWEYHCVYIPAGGLSPKVKSVSVWLRVWGGNTGKACFDDIAVIRQGEGEARNYDASKGRLSIGPAEKAYRLDRVWNGVDLSYCSQIVLPHVRAALRKLKEEGGVEYVRTREFFNGPFPVKSISADGEIEFDFSGVDRCVDFLVRELGVKLVPTIETVPPQLQTQNNKHVPKDYGLWGKTLKGLVRHWIERYGRETVSQWVFECWNEPGSDFFRGTDEEFCRLFVTYLRALTETERENGIRLRIGTPSGAMNGLLSLCMAEARKAGLDKAVTDVSIHIYGGYDGSLALYPHGIKEARGRMAPFGGENLPVHVTEFNGSAMVSGHFDTQTGAAFLVKANRIMADCGVTRGYYYCVIDHPYLKLDRHYCGDLGYMTHHDAVPKPAFNALVLLNRLAGKRLPVKASSEPFDAMAATDADGTVRVMATTFSEEEPDVFRPVPVTLELDWSGRTETLETAELIRVDSEHANSPAAFERAGSPPVAQQRDTAIWQEAARLVTEPLTGYRFENGKLIIPLTMELNSVAAITVK